ncbi:class I adenylate-forming enzyme family protein [Thermodesulfobacteriota bacterium]
MNFTESLRLCASIYSGKVCVICEDRSVTFDQLNARADKIAHALQELGLKRGDAVAVMLYNCYEYIEIFHALARVGLPMTPINYRSVPREIEYLVNHSECKAMIYGSDFADRIDAALPDLNDIPEKNLIRIGTEGRGREYESWLAEGSSDEAGAPVNENDILYYNYTSGTTGFPKAALVKNGSKLAQTLVFSHEFRLTGRDRILINMPLYHGNALLFSNFAIYLGGSAVIMPKFDPEDALACIEKYRTTTTSMVPTQYERILALPEEIKAKYDTSSMKVVLCSSAPLHPNTRLEIIKFFKSADMVEFYGASEGGLATVMQPEDHARKPGSVGRAALWQSIRLLDENKRDVPVGDVGEIYFRGPIPFEGYYKMPEATAEVSHEGWFTPGDMGYLDEDGFLHLTDRKKDMIVSGGENIYPVEIEQVIATHPNVLDVAVIGVPSEAWGEVSKALVVLSGSERTTEEEILDHCRQNLARYKVPGSVEFRKELSRSPMGKLLKGVLREKYWKGHETRIL